jgi:WD40 repeat protein
MFILPTGRDIAALAFSPDGRTLAAVTASNKAIEFWDLTERHPRLTVNVGRSVGRLAFSPAGDALLVAERTRLFFCPLSDRLRSGPGSWPSQLFLDELAGRSLSFANPTRVLLDLLWQPDGQVVEVACCRVEGGNLGADLWHWNPSTQLANPVLKEDTGRCRRLARKPWP